MGRSSENFPWMSMDGHGTKWRRKIAEKFNPLSRVHERCRRETDGRGQHIANVNVYLQNRMSRGCLYSQPKSITAL